MQDSAGTLACEDVVADVVEDGQQEQVGEEEVQEEKDAESGVPVDAVREVDYVEGSVQNKEKNMKSWMNNLVLRSRAPCILMVMMISARQALMRSAARMASTSLLR